MDHIVRLLSDIFVFASMVGVSILVPLGVALMTSGGPADVLAAVREAI